MRDEITEILSENNITYPFDITDAELKDLLRNHPDIDWKYDVSRACVSEDFIR